MDSSCVSRLRLGSHTRGRPAMLHLPLAAAAVMLYYYIYCYVYELSSLQAELDNLLRVIKLLLYMRTY
jgi:hypothetical protein